MKAREIIAGWPRGASTSKSRLKYSAWWVPYLRSWSQVDRIKLLSEQAMEKEYRDGQARMMDEWYHTGKVKTPTEHLREFWGSGESFELKEFIEPSSAGDVTLEKIQKAYGESKFGAEAGVPDEYYFDFSNAGSSINARHYYEPLEDHTAPTYGGITRNSATNGTWNQTPPFTVSGIKDMVNAMKPAEDPQVTLWRKRILEGWEKYGVSGEPLDPRTVEHLAHEFAKPLEWPKVELKMKEGY